VQRHPEHRQHRRGWTEITAGVKVEFFDADENPTGTTTFDGIETYHLGLGVDTFIGSSARTPWSSAAATM
jgi:hypothetical protein